MIDKNTGQLTLGPGKIIFPATTLNEIKAIEFSALKEERILENGWTHYTLKNVEVSGKLFNMTFFFFEEALESVSFVMNEAPFHSNTGWASTNEQTEREKAVQYDHWLNKEVGTDRNFSRGSVWASYSPKSGVSSMDIRCSS